MRSKITAHQRLFVHEYMIDFCGTKAAIRAGHSKKSAKVYASQTLALPHVKKLVERLKAKKLGKLIMTRDEILRELTIIGRLDLADYHVIEEGGTIRVKRFEEMPAGTSRALASIEETRTIAESKDGKETALVTDNIKIKGHDKIRALELLGKHEGLFPTKVEGELTVLAKLSVEALKKSAKEVEDAAADE